MPMKWYEIHILIYFNLFGTHEVLDHVASFRQVERHFHNWVSNC